MENHIDQRFTGYRKSAQPEAVSFEYFVGRERRHHSEDW
jgi:hypothetical protein